MRHQNNLLTGIRDVDREIVNNLDDKDLLQMCLVNKTYAERVCDDSYFRLRTEKGFPETVPYKDYVRVRSWKNHYLSIIKYIDLLLRDYKYIYLPEDKSPELLYLARRFVPESFTYNKGKAVILASGNGQLPVVKYLTEHGADVTAEDNEAVRWASENAHLPVVKYLTEHGADVTAEDNRAVIYASEKGHLPIVKYLVDHGADITANDNFALQLATARGHLPVVEYLVEHGAGINAADNFAVRWASKNGHSDVVKYLVEHGADLTFQGRNL